MGGFKGEQALSCELNGKISRAPLLTVKDLQVRIPTQKGVVFAVNGVSFTMNHGRTLAIVGESGSGKSMLCRAILRLLPKSAATGPNCRIHFDGQDLNALSEKQINAIRGKKIGMVLQDPMSALNPVMKVGHQVAETLMVHLGMKRKPAWERAVELLHESGIPGPEQRMSQYPYQLSGGLVQRAAIAIALACEPQLLIADEPTTALDVTVQANILNLLAGLQHKNGMAMVLITHDLEVAAAMADDIAVMYAGRILEQGPANGFFSKIRTPYTRALLDAVPHLKQAPHTRLESIEGEPPDLLRLPPGCVFALRCRYSQKRCINEAPPLITSNGSRHRFACWTPFERGM